MFILCAFKQFLLKQFCINALSALFLDLYNTESIVLWLSAIYYPGLNASTLRYVAPWWCATECDSYDCVMCLCVYVCVCVCVYLYVDSVETVYSSRPCMGQKYLA